MKVGFEAYKFDIFHSLKGSQGDGPREIVIEGCEYKLFHVK